MKLSTVITVVIIGTAMLGYLCYGWLLLQTATLGTNQWTTIEFTIYFVLWLLSLLGLPILLIVDRFQNKKEQE